MSFESKDLSVVAYANGFTMWHYETDDKTIMEEGYFNDAANVMKVGDMLVANVSHGSTLLTVRSNSSGVVEVTDMTVLGGTETD